MRPTAIALFALLAGVATPSQAADPAHPTVVELYQSQGCSSCPPANALLNELAERRPDLLPLSFAVTYWDRLGWKDRFARPAFTARQWEYSRAGGRGNVVTPQFVINGRGVVDGSNRTRLAAALRSNNRSAAGPAITAANGRITVGAGRVAAPATVWLVRYDPRLRSVPVGRGENGGRVLPHRNIVTGLTRLGFWSGAGQSFALQAPMSTAERHAILVQVGSGGPIVAARRL